MSKKNKYCIGTAPGASDASVSSASIEPRPSFLVPEIDKLGKQFRDYRWSLAEHVQHTRHVLQFDEPDPESTDGSAQPPPADQDRVRAFLRVRPLNDRERVSLKESCLSVQSDNRSLIAQPPVSTGKSSTSSAVTNVLPQKFEFHHVFDESSSQSDVFDLAGSQLVTDVIAGKNALLFAYGVTGSGKTYTLQGSGTSPGILPQCTNTLLSSISGQILSDPLYKPAMNAKVQRLTSAERKNELKLACDTLQWAERAANVNDSLCRAPSQASSASTSSLISLNDSEPSANSEATTQTSNIRYLMWVSLVEIYNDTAYDLLVPLKGQNGGARGVQKRTALKLAEDDSLREVFVTSADEISRLVSLGMRNMSFAGTALNATSSRGHCIFTLRLVAVRGLGEDLRAERMSRLAIVDLAGCERWSRAGGDRAKETCAINSSLFALRKCIAALRHNQRPNLSSQQRELVPFRDSCITRVCHTFLDGPQAHRLHMLVTVSPATEEYGETLHVLKFAAIAKQLLPAALPSSNASLCVLGDDLHRGTPHASGLLAKCQTTEQNGMDTMQWGESALADETLDDDYWQQQVTEWKQYADQLKQLLLKDRKTLKQVRKERDTIGTETRDEMHRRYKDCIERLAARYGFSLQDDDVFDQIYMASARTEYTNRVHRRTICNLDTDDDTCDEQEVNSNEKTPSANKVDHSAELAELRQKLAEYEQKFRDMEQQLSVCNEELQQKISEVNELNVCMEEAGKKFIEQQDTIGKISTENEHLKSELALLKENASRKPENPPKTPTISPSADKSVSPMGTIKRQPQKTSRAISGGFGRVHTETPVRRPPASVGAGANVHGAGASPGSTVLDPGARPSEADTANSYETARGSVSHFRDQIVSAESGDEVFGSATNFGAEMAIGIADPRHDPTPSPVNSTLQMHGNLPNCQLGMNLPRWPLSPVRSSNGDAGTDADKENKVMPKLKLNELTILDHGEQMDVTRDLALRQQNAADNKPPETVKYELRSRTIVRPRNEPGCAKFECGDTKREDAVLRNPFMSADRPRPTQAPVESTPLCGGPSGSVPASAKSLASASGAKRQAPAQYNRGRSRFDSPYRENRASKLRTASSPSLRHNHRTGSTYVIEPDASIEKHRQQMKSPLGRVWNMCKKVANSGAGSAKSDGAPGARRQAQNQASAPASKVTRARKRRSSNFQKQLHAQLRNCADAAAERHRVV